ncbi:MAG: hypothetical protein HY909_12465 [Deltaproteobacteria bacterium]|nr:hypothetical protein [Deltaproteobacteria bacterium]
MKRALLPLLALALGCSSTGTPATQTPAATGPLTDAGMLSNAPDATPPTPTPPPPPPTPPSVTAGERRAVPAPTPTVAITAPRDNATLRENRLEVRLNVRNWRNVTDAADRRHVHLILDNNEYIRVDDPTRPYALENLSEGTHVLRAFPGWETHESVKTDGAFAMVVFHVGRPSQGWTFNRRAPLLTYSRPKGTMNGADADRILLDYYLTNVPAADLGPQGVRVRPTLDGQALSDLTQWVPYYLEHLTDGEHTLVLDLLGRDGQPLPGPFNHVERRITVNHNPPPAAPPAAGAPAPDPHAGH